MTRPSGAAIAEQWARRGVEIAELQMPHGRYFTRVRPGVQPFLTELMGMCVQPSPSFLLPSFLTMFVTGLDGIGDCRSDRCSP